MRRALLPALLLSACVDLSLPEGAQVLCTTTDDCPDGFTCNRSGRCARDGDLVPPELEGALSFAPGRHLRAGQTLTVDLRASEPLARAPELVLALSPPAHATCTGSGAAWSCTYLVTGEENEGRGGTVPLLVRLVDVAQNETERRDVDTLELDFTGPRVVRANLSRRVIQPGDDVELLVTVTEPLAGGALVEAGLAAAPDGPRRPFSLVREEQSLNYVARYTVGANDPAGEVVLTAVLVDEVGNESPRTELARMLADPVPLAVVSSHVAPRHAGPDAEVVVELTLSKTLATPPRVRMGDVLLTADRSIAPPSWRFFRTVADGDAEGTFPVVVEAADEAGRVIADAVGLVTVDTTRPVVKLVRPTPRLARSDTRLALLVQADEPLSALTATGEGPTTLAFAAEPGSEGSFERTIATDDPEGGYGVRVRLVDLAGNAHEELVPDVFAIDHAAPRITRLAASPARIRDTGTVTATFVLGEELPADAVEVSLAGHAMTCAVAEAAWRCTHEMTGDELDDGAESTEIVLVRVRDAAGNTASASAGVVFDFRPPALLPGTLSVTLEPAAGSPVRAPTALGPGVGLRVAFAVDEPLAATPLLSSTPGEVSFALVASTPLTFALRAEPDVRSLPEGPLALQARLVDAAGNVADVALEAQGLVVDRTPPAPPDVETPDRVVLSRAPWGRSTGERPATLVRGAAGAVGPDTLALVFDADGAARAELGRATAAADGSFGSITLDRDRRSAWVAAADGAGNVSAAVRVRDATWTATLAGRLSGSAFENPHELVVATHAAPSLLPALGTSGEPTNAELARAGAVDGTVVRVGTGAAWTQRRPLTPPGRRGAVLGHDPVRGRTVLFGGEADGERFSDTWEWDGEQWRQVQPPTSPAPRTEATMAWDGRANRLVLFAGYHSLIGGFANLSELWDWDGVTWRRRTPSTEPPPGRTTSAMVWDHARERLVVYGGRDSTRIFADTWEYVGDEWREVAAAGPGPRLGHAMAHDPLRRRTVLFGGADGGPALDDTWEYDGAAWTRVALAGPRPPPSYGATMGFDPGLGQVVLFGGAESATFHSARWAWDGATWTELDDPVQPPGRWNHVMAVDTTRGELVVFGDSGNADDTWVRGASGWKRATPGEAGPGRRTSHGMSYDERRGEMILFAGLSSSTLRSTVDTWDGYAWGPAAFMGTPSPRYDMGMAYDPGRALTLVFGGDSPTGPRHDLWGGDGSTWEILSNSGGPRAAAGPSVAFDRVRDRLVVFGGLDADFVPSGETWLWNGATSTWQAGPAGPPARVFSPMAFDAKRGRGLLFGGSGDSDTKGDTWEWTGTEWLERHPTTPPVARDSSRLAYDARRGRVVLYGGTAGVRSLGDVWEWDGDEWHERPVHGAAPAARANMSLAYDTRRGRMVMYGGSYTELAAELWELVDDPAQRPAALLSFDVATSGEDGDALEGLSLRVDAGATGHEENATADGLEIAVWDPTLLGWRGVGLATAPVGSPAPVVVTLDHPHGLHHLLRLGRTLHVRLRPRAGQGVGTSELALDAVELVARYRR